MCELERKPPVFVAANPTNAAVPFGAFGQTNYTATKAGGDMM